MTLENLLRKGLDYAKLQFLSASKERMVDYITKYKLKNYFGDNVPEEEKERMRRGLEEITQNIMEKHGSELEGGLRKAGSKGSMALAAVNDVYAYTSQVPFSNVSTLGLYLFSAKTALEIPALIRHFSKSDWYGVGADIVPYLLLKPVRYLIPVIGAALESGAFERMVKRGIKRDIVKEFAKRYGKYVSVEERVGEKLKEPLRNNVYVVPRNKELVKAA